MSEIIRQRLARAPMLLTAYFVWVNRGLAYRRKTLSAGIALFVCWIAAVLIFLHADRAAAISALGWVQRHDLSAATICGIVAAVLVSRRRALNRMSAPRSWAAALPVERSTLKWQALVVESLPVLVLVCVLAAALGSLVLIAVVDGGVPAPVVTWLATTGAVVLGPGLSYLIPMGKQEEMYEGSRYVPHRHRAQSPIPTASLSALGSWPVRQMFASARPKAVRRVLVPILLSVPLGATASDAMLAIGVLGSIGAVILLTAASISVTAAASRWLKPLPLEAALLARSTWILALASMLVATSIESWLCWVLGAPVARCIALGTLTLVTGTVFAVTGSIFAIYADKIHAIDGSDDGV
jgi:hypothetical protein